MQVFLAGAGVMALEMVGGRLLTPRFGSSVYTWGALIGVVMTGLALGYALGGRLGDRRPYPGTLAALLLGGAAVAIALPLGGPPVIAGLAAVLPDARWGPIVASLVIIGPPSLLLGAVTPVAVRLRTEHVSRAGTVAGSLSGLSTAGSILGTFATVFVLMPVLELGAILVLLGAILGGASLLTGRRRLPRAALVVGLLVASQLAQSALAPALVEQTTGLRGEILYSRSTAYHELYVTEDTDPAYASPVRALYLDSLRHGAIFVDDPTETPLHYVGYFHLGPLVNPEAQRVLFIGGGAMTGPKQFLATYPDVEVTVVEVDPEVVEAAERFFAVPDDPRLEIVVQDGRRFLETSDVAWDIIVLDAYARTFVPFHLLTVEFLELVRDSLAPGGLVVSNLIGSLEGDTSKLLRSELRTMGEVFTWNRQAPTNGVDSRSLVQEVMVLASVGTPFGWGDARERAGAWQAERGRPYVDLVSAAHDLQLPLDDVPVLTDSFAPVEGFVSPITRETFHPG